MEISKFNATQSFAMPAQALFHYPAKFRLIGKGSGQDASINYLLLLLEICGAGKNRSCLVGERFKLRNFYALLALRQDFRFHFLIKLSGLCRHLNA